MTIEPFVTDATADQVALDIAAQRAGYVSFASMCEANGWEPEDALVWVFLERRGAAG